MIKSKQDYQFYLESDRLSLDRRKHLTLNQRIMNIFFKDQVWEFQKALRKIEYLKNSHTGLVGRIRYALAYWRFDRGVQSKSVEIVKGGEYPSY